MVDTGKFAHAPDRSSAFLELNGFDEVDPDSTTHRVFIGGGHLGDNLAGGLRVYRADIPVIDIGARLRRSEPTGDIVIYGGRSSTVAAKLGAFHVAGVEFAPAGFLELYGPYGRNELRVQIGTDATTGTGFILLKGSHRTVRIDEDGLQLWPDKGGFRTPPAVQVADDGPQLFHSDEGPQLFQPDEGAQLAPQIGGHATPTPFSWDFVAHDPQDPTKEIHYCVVEGPEVGVFLRGTARLSDGRAHVTLPDHFALVASPDGLTAQLTARNASSLGVAATSLTVHELVIEELAGGRGSYEVDYLLHGSRLGCESYSVVRPRKEHTTGALSSSEALSPDSLQKRARRSTTTTP